MTCMFSLFRKRRKSDPSSTDTPRSERQSGSMSTQATSRRHDVDQLTKDMARATISSVQTVPLANSAFIGGFNPALGNSLPSVPQTQSGQSGRNGVLPASHSSYGTPSWPEHIRSTSAATQPRPGPLPIPPRMDIVPTSRTMQYAQTLGEDVSAAQPRRPSRPPLVPVDTRPHTDPPRPSIARPPGLDRRVASSPLQHAPATIISASGPLRPSHQGGRARAASNPPSPSTLVTTIINDNRCSAFTKAGARCSRVVKQPVSLDAVDPDVEPKQERFCHQHLKEQLKHTQFPLKGDIWVDFADWIPSYLHPNTQAALRKEMQRVISAADEPGYIYVYQYRDLHGPDYLCFKVGRTVTLNKRLGEWEKQCGSRVPHLRHWAPSSVDERDQGIVGGGVKQGKPAAWCHRLERLIHLELADQLRYAPYLDPKYPNIEGERKLAEIPKKAPCSDCGKMHREIFPLPRAPDGPFKDRELENIVIPVVDKWTQFMGIYGDAFNIQEKQLTDGQ